MLNIEKIQESLAGLVGVRPSLDDNYGFIVSGSSSGLYLNDVELFDIKFFVDNLSTLDKDPSLISSAWVDSEKSAIANTVNSIFNKPDFIDRQVMFRHAFDSSSVSDVLSERFYGYEIEVSERKNVSFTISRVLVEAFGNGTIRIGLYASGHSLALYSKEIEFPSHAMPFYVDLNWTINNAVDLIQSQFDDVSPYKGKYWIGITNIDATDMRVFTRDYERGLLMSQISDLSIKRVISDTNPTEWEKNETTDLHNGLNFDITVNYDYTDLVLNNKNLFAKAIQLNWAMSVLRMALNSTRSNRNQRVSSELYAQILLVINGNRNFNSQRVYGLHEMLLGEIARVQSEIDKMINGYELGGIVLDTAE